MTWKTAATIGGIVGGVLTGFHLLTEIYDWFARPAVALSADVRYGFHFTPPSTFAALAPVSSGPASETAIREDLDTLLLPEKIARSLNPHLNEIASDLNRRIHLRLLQMDSRYRLGSLKGYMLVHVTNRGTREASNITLHLPSVAEAQIFRDGSRPMNLSATRDAPQLNRIKIEHLAPDEGIDIVAWSGSTLSRWDFDSVKVVHETGLGRVRVYHPVGRIGQWFDNNFQMLLFALLIVVASIGLHYLSAPSSPPDSEREVIPTPQA